MILCQFGTFEFSFSLIIRNTLQSKNISIQLENLIFFCKKAARLPGAVDLNAAKPVGPFSMLGAMSDAKVKEGMGVLLELAKVLPAMKKS